MRHHRAHLLRQLLAPLGALLACAAVAGYLVVGEPASPGTTTPLPARGNLVPVAETLNGTPPATSGAGAGSRTAVPLTARTTSSRLYRFLLLQPDGVTPIRWNPCAPVHYKVAVTSGVPVSEIARVRAVFDTVGKALDGVRFVYDGRTTVVPDTVDDSGRAGTDIVFAFALPGRGASRSGLLSGWEAGRGGFAASGVPSGTGPVVERPTHGSVVIDASKWKQMTRHDRTVLYLHEIGHVVGLDHPADGHQIMSSGAYDLPTRYQRGDVVALAQLGREAGCTP